MLKMQVLNLLLVVFLAVFSESIYAWKIEDSGQKEDLVSELSVDQHSEDGQILQFSAFGQKYSLSIQAADDIFAPNFQITTESNSTIVDQKTARLNGKFYTAKNGRGSFYIANIDSHLAVNGIVNNQIRIRPENGIHIASRVISNPNSNAFSNDMVRHHLQYPVDKIIKDEDTEPLPDVISVEVFAVIDTVLHKNLLKKGMSIEEHLGILWNQVQNEYKSFSNPKINFVIVGSTVLTNMADWIKETIVKETYNTIEVNSHKLLNNFGKWLFTKRKDITIPNYDIAILHTGLDLASPTKDNSYDKDNLGVANFQQICITSSFTETVFSSGVMEDSSTNGDFVGILTIAHEVGHLLGADHDNELPKERNCPARYIMYFAIGDGTTEEFSQCSVNDVKKILSRRQANCVRQIASPKVKGLTPDEVCTKRLGRPSKGALPRFQGKIDPCMTLFCQTDENGAEASSDISPDGMICAKDKKCRNGVCEN